MSCIWDRFSDQKLRFGCVGRSVADIRLKFIEQNYVRFASTHKLLENDFTCADIDFGGEVDNATLSPEQARQLADRIFACKDCLFWVSRCKIYFSKFSLLVGPGTPLSFRLFFDLSDFFARQRISPGQLSFACVSKQSQTLYLVYEATLVGESAVSQQQYSFVFVIVCVQLVTKQVRYKVCLFREIPRLKVIPSNRKTHLIVLQNKNDLIELSLKNESPHVEAADANKIGEQPKRLLGAVVTSCGKFLVELRASDGLLMTRLRDSVEVFRNKDKTLVDGQYALSDLVNKELKLRILVYM